MAQHVTVLSSIVADVNMLKNHLSDTSIQLILMLFVSNVAAVNSKLNLHSRQHTCVTRRNALTLKNAPIVKSTNKLHVCRLNYNHVNISHMI